MLTFKTLLTVIGAVTVLVLAGNTVALAATGHAFVLGKTNKANKVTTLKRTTSGPALSLHTTSSGAAPMTVNGKGKVANLNADTVDGLDSSALRHHSYVFTRNVNTPTSGFVAPVSVPVGTYAFTFNAYLSGGSGNTYCELEHVHGTTTNFAAIATSTNTSPGITGAGVVTTAAGDTLTLICGGSSTSFTTQSGTPVQLVFTPTAVVGGGSF